jgi:oligosaccharyltransferase complex subunit gamma
LIVTGVGLIVSTAIIYSLWPYVLPLLQSRILWGTTSMILILTFTSGYMWNKIKNAPYVAADQSGKVSWIAGGYQNQLGMESQVVGGICKWLGSLSLCRLPTQTSP